jgi:hypothetical protein
MEGQLMDRNEALNLFVRANFKLMLSEKPAHEIFKRAKLSFFLDGHKDVGVPRDEEIAERAIYYLVKNGAISSESKLHEILSLPFFSRNIRNKEPFIELLNVQKSRITIVDPRKLSEAVFADRLKEELKQEIIAEKTQEIEEAIEQKKEEYLLVPSVLDSIELEETVHEPELESEEQFISWWKHLKLLADPFPMQEGLARIADDLYEKVVYKTPIFEKYMILTKETSEELFKDAIFFGEFGSGKTTLFDYLRKPLMNERIFTTYLQLYAEDTLQALLAKFRKKLFEGLCQLHELLYESDPKGWLKSSDFQEGIELLFERFAADEDVKGLIIIIDDLHKNLDEFDIAMRFVNNLQIFRAELLRKIPRLNVGFFVAGSSEWEKTVKNDPKFSGSYIRHEIMPPVTEEAAHEMLNRRLSAFATNPDTIKTINIDFVKRIYRGLQNNKLPVTFRSFIRATITEFEKGNFSILSVDPVHISKEKLAEIRETLEWDKILKKKIDNLVFGGGIQREENRKKALDLLIYTYLQKGLSEDSAIFKDDQFSFQRLARAGLIQKVRLPSGSKWVISRELDEMNRKILKDYNLSIEDYLTKIYIAPLHARAGKITKTNEELLTIDSLINSLTNREVKNLAKTSRDKHAEIIEQMDRHERMAESKEIVLACTMSLSLLTKALARFLGLQVAPKDDLSFLSDFWKDFWYSPGEIAEFMNQASACKEPGQGVRIWYSCIVYRDAYSAVLNFFADEVDKSRYMMIPLAGLSNDEIRHFHEIRTQWAKNAYFEAADLTTQIVEKKLRSFLFNVFTLLYGDRDARLDRVDTMTKHEILQNIQKDQAKGMGLSKNEFEQLNRGNYKNFMISFYNKDVGRRNWTQVFKQVFAPLTENDIRDFLDIFADFNIATSHAKYGALGAEQQTRIFNYVLKALDIVKRMNQTYTTLVEKGLFVLEGQYGAGTKLFFSLGNFEDKDALTPIFVKGTTAQRVGEQMLRQGRMSLDLEDAQFLASYFSIGYREFMGILARSVTQSPKDAKKTGIRVRVESSRGSSITLKITNYYEVGDVVSSVQPNLR